METSLKDQIAAMLETLSPQKQRQLLDFGRSLQDQLPPGIPGEVLAARARAIGFDSSDLAEMAQAIEEGCEKTDPTDWQ